MSHDGNLCVEQPMNQAHAFFATFDLHGFGTAVFEKASSVLDGLLLVYVIRSVGHIGDDQCTLDSTTDGAHVMKHLFDRDWEGVLVSQHDHGERIAYQDHVDSSLVDEPRRCVIVGRETRNWRAALLFVLYGINGDLGVVTKTRRGDAHCSSSALPSG